MSKLNFQANQFEAWCSSFSPRLIWLTGDAGSLPLVECAACVDVIAQSCRGSSSALERGEIRLWGLIFPVCSSPLALEKRPMWKERDAPSVNSAQCLYSDALMRLQHLQQPVTMVIFNVWDITGKHDKKLIIKLATQGNNIWNPFVCRHWVTMSIL